RDLVERDVFLTVARRANPPGDALARAQGGFSEMRERHVGVLGTRPVVETRAAQESVSLEAAEFENPFGVDRRAALGAAPQQVENKMTARSLWVDPHAQRVRPCNKVVQRLGVKLVEMELGGNLRRLHVAPGSGRLIHNGVSNNRPASRPGCRARRSW